MSHNLCFTDSKRQSTQYNVSIVNDDLDKQLFSKPTGYNGKKYYCLIFSLFNIIIHSYYYS